jgi:hypothetical protein
VIEFTFAFRKVKVSRSTSVTIISSVVVLARTLASTNFANVVSRSIDVTVARTAFGVAVVAKTALVAVRRKVLGSTFALSTALSAVSRRVENITLTFY